MARPKVYSINLTDEERSKLNKTIKNKTTCKTVLKRCQILRNLDETKGCGLTHAQIAHTYAVCPGWSFQMDAETAGRKIPCGTGDSHKQGTIRRVLKKMNFSPTEMPTGASRQRKM